MARLSAAAGVLALAVAGACGDRGPEPAAEAGAVPESERYGGTAVVAFLAELQSMNEFVAADAVSDAFQSHVLFTTPFRHGPDLKLTPYLAEVHDTLRSAGELMEVTLALNPDVRWHDDEPTTAHDLKFTFDRIQDPATAYPHAAALELYDSAVVRDSFTIAFYLEPHPDFLSPWADIAPMPRHILQGVSAEQMPRHPFGTRAPVGNGPFRFVEHRDGERWVFEANPDFPAALGGRPRLDRLVYRVIPEPTTVLSEFLTGAVDVYLSVAPEHARRIENDGSARLITYPSRRYEFIAWNSRRPLFEDPAVRRALTMAIDREEIVSVARSGLGEPAAGPVPPWHWAQHPDLEPWPYDPEEARRILTAAGWVDTDGDGVRERDGVRASFVLVTNPNRWREDIMTLVQADLAEVGIEVRPRVREAQSLLQAVTSPERRFDALVLGWESSFRVYDRDRGLFACSALDGPYQFSSYCNPRVDEILAAVARTEDRGGAAPLWHEYQEILHQDQPFTFLYYDVRANAVRERLQGVQMDIRGPLISVAEWWIHPDERLRAGPATP